MKIINLFFPIALLISNDVALARGAISPIDQPPKSIVPFKECHLDMRKIASFEKSVDRPLKLYVRYEDGARKILFTAGNRVEGIDGQYTAHEHATDDRWTTISEVERKLSVRVHVFYLPLLRELRPEDFGYTSKNFQIEDVYYEYSAKYGDKIDVLGVRIDGKKHRYPLIELEAAFLSRCGVVDPLS